MYKTLKSSLLHDPAIPVTGLHLRETPKRPKAQARAAPLAAAKGAVQRAPRTTEARV